MATWSDLKFKLITTGDETGTWGDTTNANLGSAIEQAITGTADVTFADADVTLVLTDTTDLQQGRALRLNLTGVVSTTRTLYVPDIQKFYIVSNTLSSNIVVRNSTGSEYYTVPTGTTAMLFSKGTGVTDAITFFSGAILSPAAVIGGGTIDDTAIGLTTPNVGYFTTLQASSSVSGAGFNSIFGTPPPIGSGTPNTGAFTTLSTTGNTTLGDDVADTVTMNAGTMAVPNNLVFSGTGSVRLPVGTTAQQPTGVTGMIRYNTSIGNFEGYKATFWDTLGGSNLTNTGFWQNIQTISGTQAISAGYNANSVGPITIAAGGSVTVPTGSRWLIL